MVDGDVAQPDGASDLLTVVSDQAEAAGGSDASHHQWRTADESLALLDALIDEVLPAADSDASLHETLAVDSSVADVEQLLDDLRQQRGQRESETIPRDPQHDSLEQTTGPLADEAQADIFGADPGTSVHGQTLLEGPHAIAGAEATGGGPGSAVGSQQPGAAVVLLDSATSGQSSAGPGRAAGQPVVRLRQHAGFPGGRVRAGHHLGGNQRHADPVAGDPVARYARRV